LVVDDEVVVAVAAAAAAALLLLSLFLCSYCCLFLKKEESRERNFFEVEGGPTPIYAFSFDPSVTQGGRGGRVTLGVESHLGGCRVMVERRVTFV
jgi:hypothetical protein